MLQRVCRESFREVPWHPTRWWEFPWVYREVQRRAAGWLPWLAHLGASLSPLPDGGDAVAGLVLRRRE